MPDPKTQRYLGWIATIGVLTSCFGCGLYATNQVNAGTAFLILAWLILVPTFVYLLRTRRRLKRVVRQREQLRKQELEALANVGEMMKAADGERQAER